MSISVALLHGRSLMGEVLSARLASEPDMLVLAAVSSFSDLLSTAAVDGCDVVVVDVSDNSQDALHRIRALKHHCPQHKILVLVPGVGASEVVSYIECGAGGYITWNASYADAVRTIRDVHDGRVPADPDVVLKALERIRELDEAAPMAGAADWSYLTAREREIAELVSEGCFNKEISRRLGISLATTKSHVHRILKKLRCVSRAQLAVAHRGRAERDPPESDDGNGPHFSAFRQRGSGAERRTPAALLRENRSRN